MALYTHVAAALIGLAVGLGAGWKARTWKADADAAAVRDAAWDQHRRTERGYLEVAERVDKADARRKQAAQAAAARDRDDLERVRIAAALADQRESAAAACEPVERQFAECRSALAEGAGVVAEGRRLVRELGDQTQGLRELAAGISGVQLSDDPAADR